MFTLGALGLTAAYVVLALLLLNLNLYSNWSWWVKAVMIGLTSGFYIVTYFSLPPLLGWPTDAALPERFRLIAVHVQEPNKFTGTEGRIFLWATAINAPPDSEPRAYRLLFAPTLHERAIEARNKLRKGIPQLGEVEKQAQAPPGTHRMQPSWARRALGSRFMIRPIRCSRRNNYLPIALSYK
jgi:hypothetical protein